MAVPDISPTTHDFRRLCSLLPNDHQMTSEDLTRLTFIPDHSGTPRQSSPTSQDLTRPATALSRPTKDLTRPFQTIKVGRGRPPSRLSVTRVLGSMWWNLRQFNIKQLFIHKPDYSKFDHHWCEIMLQFTAIECCGWLMRNHICVKQKGRNF